MKLDRTNLPEWLERIAEYETDAPAITPCSYPGYPEWPLARTRARPLAGLDRALQYRRSATAFESEPLSKTLLSRLLQMAHGINAEHARGPTPSAGGLQALELYLVAFDPSWLPSGVYHFDRSGNHLSQIIAQTQREQWMEWVPSMNAIQGGPILFILVGDRQRVEEKYGERGLRFLLLEAGHLGQNICLLAASLGLAATPLGGFFEREIANHMALRTGDEVLYLLLCGKPAQL